MDLKNLIVRFEYTFDNKYARVILKGIKVVVFYTVLNLVPQISMLPVDIKLGIVVSLEKALKELLPFEK